MPCSTFRCWSLDIVMARRVAFRADIFGALRTAASCRLWIDASIVGLHCGPTPPGPICRRANLVATLSLNYYRHHNVSDFVARRLALCTYTLRRTPRTGARPTQTIHTRARPPRRDRSLVHSSSARALRAASSSASRAATLAACWVRASSISSSMGRRGPRAVPSRRGRRLRRRRRDSVLGRWCPA